MKPSEMWDKASSELTQVQRIYGNAGQKTACAYGALVYYVTNGKTSDPSYVSEDSQEWLTLYDIRCQLRAKDMGTGIIIINNDEKDWSFKQFADWARKHEL